MARNPVFFNENSKLIDDQQILSTSRAMCHFLEIQEFLPFPSRSKDFFGGLQHELRNHSL